MVLKLEQVIRLLYKVVGLNSLLVEVAMNLGLTQRDVFGLMRHLEVGRKVERLGVF